MSLYPLRFEPLLKRYLWGGRRLETVLGKPLPPGDDYAESWEIVDLGENQSRVLAGPLAGTTLADLVAHRGTELFGRHAPQNRFPLLFKFLDSQTPLSVQVHPGDAVAARLTPSDLGKTEAWVVLHAEPGSAVYAGLKRGFDRRAVEREIKAGTVELCLHRFAPQPGDCIFIPAGTVHALGAGFVIAEIQQASNTTYRLYDWKRLGPDGCARELHWEAGLAAIDFERGPVAAQVPQKTGQPHVERLVACDKFVLDRWSASEPHTIGGDDRFHIISIVRGSVQVAGDPLEQPLERGQTLLVPASIGEVALTPLEPTELLDMYLPI